jgi:hypothetical protein
VDGRVGWTLFSDVKKGEKGDEMEIVRVPMASRENEVWNWSLEKLNAGELVR